MDNEIIEQNSFFSRGCKCVPKPFQPNEKVFDHSCNKLDVNNWLEDFEVPAAIKPFNIIEVRFKNSRKDFFKLPDDLQVEVGDIVAVEASPGHDIGIVTMVGELVRYQMNKKKVNPTSEDIKKVYRKAKSTDVEKWISCVDIEEKTMHKARSIAVRLNLNMKISDVEFQGDRTKAIFYYTADERVDFRELIKLYAEEFSVRIEMRQIGVRQEASRLGGISSCGRELCCSTWLVSFKSVSTNAARQQQLSLNPQKLAGQCGKLKCCLNFEYDCYVDAMKEFPDFEQPLKTKKGNAIFQKADIFKKILYYSYENDINNFIPVSLNFVIDTISKNSKGVLPEALEAIVEEKQKSPNYNMIIEQDDLTRFD